MLVDSHCHLDFDVFDEDRDAVFERAAQAGVGYLVTISTRVSEADRVRAVADPRPNTGYSVGVHPHNAGDEGDVAVDRLVSLAKPDRVVGIGESGLDYYYDNSPRDAQQASFRRHCQAAVETGLPLIVHTRDADEDTVRILEEEAARGPLKGVIHCFTSSNWLARRAVDLGFYVSFSGILTFKKATDIQTTASELPRDRVLVETDAPFLAPVPNRGKRNEPAYVMHTAAKLAALQGCAVDEIAESTTENFFRLFGRAVRPRVATG